MLLKLLVLKEMVVISLREAINIFLGNPVTIGRIFIRDKRKNGA